MAPDTAASEDGGMNADDLLPGRAYTDDEGYVWVYDPAGGDLGKGLVWYSPDTCDYWRMDDDATLTLVPLPDATDQ